MSGFPILDLVIGIIFIFFLLSIICSSAVELWLSIRSTRAKLLEQWIKRIFNAQALDSTGIPKIVNGKAVSVGQEIMDHCMVTALSKTGKSTSYIDSGNFVSALLDKITLEPASSATNEPQPPPASLGEYIDKIKKSTVISGELKRTILSFAHEAQASAVALTEMKDSKITTTITTIKSSLDQFRERLENWYDTNADRLTGTLKRKKVLPATFIIATVMTISLNTDTVEICKYLYNNKDASKQLATTALNDYQNYRYRIDSLSKEDTGAKRDTYAMNALNKKTDQLKNDIDSLTALSLPIGWQQTNVSNFETFKIYFFQLKHLGGWLATILAICMGAPFWFDLLNKIGNLRGAGPKPSVTEDSSKK